eukprot:UN30485
MKQSNSGLLTQKQTIWVRKQRLLSSLSLPRILPRPESVCGAFYDIVESRWFDPFIILCILTNTVIMCIDYYDASDELQDTLRVVNLVFVFIFAVEAILKIWAYGFIDYISDGWNIYDFVIVVASLLGLIVNASKITSVFRVIRIGRVLRLIKRAPMLRALFLTLLFSSPSLLNIGGLLLVIFFIFSILGVALFGEVVQTAIPYDPFGDGNTWAFTDQVNFDNFENAMSAVYRMATGDGWEDVYAYTIVDGYECDYLKTNYALLNDGRECGEKGYSVAFFVTFGIFGTMVMINLFIAVILDVYKDNVELERNLQYLTPLEDWRAAWIETEKKWREENDLSAKTLGFMPVKYFLGTFKDVPQLVGLMLHACNLRVSVDVETAQAEDFERFGVNSYEELVKKKEQEFCGELKFGRPSEADKKCIVTKDHIGAIIESHKWHLMCRMLNPGTMDEQCVVYYDDAIFSIYYCIVDGPEFPLYKYDDAVERPIVKWWKLAADPSKGGDESEEGFESDEEEDLLAQMEKETMRMNEEMNEMNDEQ